MDTNLEDNVLKHNIQVKLPKITETIKTLKQTYVEKRQDD